MDKDIVRNIIYVQIHIRHEFINKYVSLWNTPISIFLDIAHYICV